MDRARGAIRALMDLAPAEALVRRDGREVRVAGRRRCAVGDTVSSGRARRSRSTAASSPGDSHVNQAPVTGESLPVEKRRATRCLPARSTAAARSTSAVTRLRRDSTLARIIHLVERAQAQRAPSQAFVDRFARIYTPAVLVAGGRRRRAARRCSLDGAVEHLVLPLARAAGDLLPVRAGDLDAGRRSCRRWRPRRARACSSRGAPGSRSWPPIRCVAFDKTGTLTDGRLHVVDVLPVDGAAASEVLRVAASLEMRSEHPIGRAIVEHALTHGISRRCRSRRSRRCRAAAREARRRRPTRSSSAATACSRSAGCARRRSKRRSTRSPRAGCSAVMVGAGGDGDRRHRRGRRAARGRARCRGPAARAGDRARRAADRRSRTGRARAGRVAGSRRLSGRAAAGGQGRRPSRSCARATARSRWWATASTTRRRWRPPTSASRWASPAPTRRSRRRTSR